MLAPFPGHCCQCLVLVQFSFLVPCSIFLIPHPSFLIPRSSFLFPHSSFLIPHSSFLIPHSSFLVPRSSFFIPHSLFLVPCSSFLDHGVLPKIHYFYTKHTNGIKCPTQRPNIHYISLLSFFKDYVTNLNYKKIQIGPKSLMLFT
jgi:hypothetical protein